MPSTCCSVPQCSKRGGHRFPADPEVRQKWIRAVKRVDEVTRKDWQPSDTAVVCKAHFTPSDYVSETIDGLYLFS